MTALYDTIGVGYRDYRRPDPRIAAMLNHALGDARSVVNVGAGGGSYEPRDRRVAAIELSRVMIAQRAPDAAPVVQASAESLPFPPKAFDAATAILTLHHWPDVEAGMRELARVSRCRVVLLTWVSGVGNFWLRDYIPEVIVIDQHLFPSYEQMSQWLGPLRVIELPVPHDCSDGFLCAYWRRPEAYLDPGVRRAISTFARIENLQPRLERLRDDLADGTWQRRYGHLLQQEAMDFGYRIIVAEQRR